MTSDNTDHGETEKAPVFLDTMSISLDKGSSLKELSKRFMSESEQNGFKR